MIEQQALVAMHVFVGVACVFIAAVLLFDRAAATRAMFDNRLAFGALVVLCGLDHIRASLASFLVFQGAEAAIMLATCVVSIAVAGLTVRAFLVKRAALA